MTRTTWTTRAARTMTRIAALALGLCALAGASACSGGISDSVAGSGSTDATGTYVRTTGGVLHVYTWAGYLPDDVIAAYEKDTGTKVTVDTFDSNESLEAKMQSTGGKGYDIIMPSDYMVKQMISEGLLMKFDATSLPNASNIKSDFADPYYDPGLEYSAPYIVGYTGFVYDSTAVSASAAPTSWKTFFAAAGSLGSSQMLDDQVEVTNAALRAVGYDQCTTRPIAYEKASRLLSSYRSRVGVISSEGVADRLASGEQKIGMAWSYDAHQAIVSNPNLRFVYPTDGTTRFVDNMAISRGASNIGQAKTFINWMLDPKNKVKVEESAGAGSVLKGGDELLPAAMRKDNSVVPSAAEKRTLRTERSCTNSINDFYTELYEDFRR